MKTSQILPFQYSDHDAVQLKITKTKKGDQTTGNAISQ